MPLPHNLKSYPDIMKPEYVAQCDRCAQIRLTTDMDIQYQWLGNALKPLNIYVCKDRCLDVPSQFLRPAIIGPEPVPPPIVRPWFYAQQNAGGTVAPTPQEIADLNEVPEDAE